MKLQRNLHPLSHMAVGDKTRQNPGLSPILVFFSDLEVELLTFKILFLIVFEFCFWNLIKKFEADVLICMCKSKIGQKLVPVHWIENKNYYQKKHFFDQKFVFRKRKKNWETMLFFEEKNFRFNALGPNFVQFYSYTYQNIRYILLFKIPKTNSKKTKKNFKVKSFSKSFTMNFTRLQ